MKPLIGTQRSRVQTEALEDRGNYITMSKVIAALENVSREIRQMALAMHEMNHTRTNEIVKALDRIETKLTVVPANKPILAKEDNLPFCKLGIPFLGPDGHHGIFCPVHGYGFCKQG